MSNKDERPIMFDGGALKATRKRKHLTLQQVADMVSSSKSYIWELEKNPNLEPSFGFVASLAKALRVNINTLSCTR